MPISADPADPTRRHRSHAFVASRDPAFVRQAVRVQAVRDDATTILLTLSPGNVGHAFPTGDLFRRLVVVAEVPGDDGRPITSASAT
jgi:hypothetical protein